MRPSARGVALGILGLAVFDAVVSRPGAAAATGGAWKFANDALNRFISPTVGVFGATTTPSTSAGTTALQQKTGSPLVTPSTPPSAVGLLFSST